MYLPQSLPWARFGSDVKTGGGVLQAAPKAQREHEITVQSAADDTLMALDR